MRKHKAPQVEINWGEPESFKLQIQTATDGDRVAKGAAQLAADRAESESKQTEIQTQI